MTPSDLEVNISKLNKEDIGKWVLYTAGHGETEKGRIKSWNDKFIFVVYKCDNQWDRFQEFTGCATDPKDLKFFINDEIGDGTGQQDYQ